MLKVIRLLHILPAIYNLLYVYTPLHGWQYGFASVQFVSMPLLILSGVGFVLYRRGYFPVTDKKTVGGQ